MNHYRFTPQSKQDLIAIRRFTLENWGKKQSATYLLNLRKTLRLLATMPTMGKSCQQELGKNIYRFPYKNHSIYYLIHSTNEIIIIAILHQSRLPNKHLTLN